MSGLIERLRIQHQLGLMDLPEDWKYVSWGTAADALEARDKTIAELVEAFGALEGENVFSVHVGYDGGAGGGNFVYADAIRVDTEAFLRLKFLISQAQSKDKAE